MSYVLFHDYREDWQNYPTPTNGLRLKYWELREVMPHMEMHYCTDTTIFPNHVFWKFDGRLAALEKDEYSNPYYYLCDDCFVCIDKQDSSKRIIEMCEIDKDIKDQFRRLLVFINKEISLRIDILNDESIGVLQRIAIGMIYNLPKLSNDEKIALQFNLQCNIRRARKEWLDYYSKVYLGLPF